MRRKSGSKSGLGRGDKEGHEERKRGGNADGNKNAELNVQEIIEKREVYRIT